MIVPIVRSLRHGAPILIGSLALATGAHAATPSAVEAAKRNVVVIHAGPKLTGAAVRVGGTDYVTASTLVARTSEITANFEQQPPSRARKVGLSNLPLGLTLLRLPAGAPSAAKIAIGAPTPPAGKRVWVVGPIGSRDRGQRVVARPTTVRATPGDLRGLRQLSLTASPGFKGSAVVDDGGRLLGIAVPPPEGLGTSASRAPIYLLQLREQPQVASAAATPESSQFPAIPVTIGLGILMVFGQLLLTWRARKDETPIAAPTSSGTAAPAAPATPEEPEEEIAITLRP